MPDWGDVMSYLHIAALLVSMMVGAAGGWGVKGAWSASALEVSERRAAKAETALLAQRSEWERQAKVSAEEQRAEEQRRQQTRDKEIQNAQVQAKLDAGRVAASRRAADQLREHVARLAANADQGCGSTSVAAGSPATTGPGLVLANLYRGVDDEAHELAQAFDLARRAGLVCERLYDSLSSRTPNP